MLKAFLLVAGLGKRLRPLTNTTPKCLLPINGKPLLEIWLEHLARSGVDEVLINTHWLHAMVKDFVEKWPAARNIRIKLFHEPVLLGSAGTLLANKEWAGRGPFFIIYGDNLTNINLNKMLAFHVKGGQPLTLRVYEAEFPNRVGVVTVDKSGNIIEFEEKPKAPKSNLGAGGIYIADHRIYEYFPDLANFTHGTIMDLSYHVLPNMVGHMKAYDSKEFSIDIGNPASYEKAQIEWPKMSANNKAQKKQ